MQNQWYIARDGKQYGPVTDADLTQLVQKRELLDGDFLWRQGFDNWLPVAQVPEIRDLNQQAHQINAPHLQEAIQPSGENVQPGENSAQGQYAHSTESQANEEHRQNQPQQNYSTSVDNSSVNQQTIGHNAPQTRSLADTATGLAAESKFGSQSEPDLTNKSLAEVANQYPTLHESEKNQFEQRQDVQDLIEEDEDAFLKTQNSSFDQSAVQETNNSNSYLQSGLEGASAKQVLQTGETHSIDSQTANTQPLGMATRDMSSQFQVNSQYAAQDAGSDNGLTNMHAGQARSGLEGNSGQHANAHSGAHGEKPLKQKSGFSWPLGIGIGVAALFILVIGLTFALPFIVPPETIKKQISAAMKEKTGRDITFKGKISYRFFPSFGIDLNNIIIHNPPSIKGPNFLQLGRLQADLKLIPLLSKRVEIGRIVMHRPEIALIKDSRGRVNYEFKTASLSPSQFKTTLLRSLGVKHLSNSTYNSSTGRKSSGFKVAQAETLDTSDIIARTLEKLEQEEAEAQNSGDTKTSEEQDTSAAEDPKGPSVNEGELEDVQQAGLNTDIIIGEIEIVNGAVKVIDQKENSETMVSAINLSVQAPDLKKDVVAKGTLRYLEDRINLAANISTLGPLLKGDEVDTNLTFNSDRFEGKFDGKVSFAVKVEFKGDTDVQTYSLQNLLSWLGVDVPKRGYGGAYIRGKLSGTPDVFQLTGATIKVDNSVLIGALRLRPNGTRPKIEAQLRTDLLDFSPYMQQQASIEHKLIDDITGPRKTAVAAWKSEQIDVSFLKAFDAVVQLSASRLIFQKHQLEKAQVGLKVNAGLLTAQLPSFSLYGGTGSLNVSLNGAKPRPTLKGRIGLKQIQIQPLLKNAADLAWLSGVGNVDLDILSSGNTESQLISALNGTGRITLADGAIEGVNIPGMIRNVQSGKLLDTASKPTEKTDFSDLTASFVITRGVIENKDLLMKGPLLRMTGKGILNLPTEQIDYGLQPKLVNSLAGQGGNAALAGINIPIRVKGPMANPKFIPDAAGLLENNGEAINNTVKSVKNAVKKLKKKKISSEEMKGLLNGLIDGKQEGGNLLDGILQ
jgi:AsmA protein